MLGVCKSISIFGGRSYGKTPLEFLHMIWRTRRAIRRFAPIASTTLIHFVHKCRVDSVTRQNLLILRSTPARRQSRLRLSSPRSTTIKFRKYLTALSKFNGAPEGTRTPDLSVRNAAFYPLNYGCMEVPEVIIPPDLICWRRC